jgi:HAE1 family hydrophobic/amphiphilic exporter-1
MGLTKAAITRPVFILMLMLVAILMGFLAYSGMRKEQSPDVSFGVVTVLTPYPGASPDEVNTLISRKVEEAVSGINGLRTVTATSQEGDSIVVAQFDIGTNMDSALSDVRSKVDAIANDLPTDALKSTVSKIDTSSSPVLTMVVSSNTMSNKALRDLADDKLSDIFGQIPGVASVSVNGGDVRELEVQLRRNDLLKYGLGITEIQQAVFGATENVPSGHLLSGNQEYNIRVLGEFKKPEDLENMVLSVPDPTNPLALPTTVRLKDVADVLDTTAERTSYTRLNGKEAVSISVQKSRDGNSIEIVKAADEAIAGIKKTYGVDVEKIFNDATQIEETLGDLTFSLCFGIFLVATIVFIFLHNLRGTIIVSIAIPVCLMTSFIAMVALGFTINSMSMLSLSLAIGVLVDDAIVVLENIYRHLRKGEDPREAAINGRSEIGLAAIAITFADVVVFTPIGFMGGILGEFFKPLGLTFAATVLISLFVSFTVTPMLASRWYKSGEDMEHPTGGFARAFERGFHGLERFYRRVLESALKHRWFVFISGWVVFFGTFMLIGGSFAPTRQAAQQMAAPLIMISLVIGLIAFGISYWPKALAQPVRRTLTITAFTLSALIGAAMFFNFGIGKHMGLMMGILAGIGGFLGGLAAIFAVSGVAAFLANLFNTHHRSRNMLSALAFGFCFPIFALIGFGWAQWKGEGLFKFGFMPPSDNGSVSINVELSPDQNLKATQLVVNKLEKICMSDQDVKYVLSQVGSASGGGFGAGGAVGQNRAAIQVTLFDKASFFDSFSKPTEHIRHRADTTVAADLLEKTGKIPGANITISANNTGFGLPIQFSLVGQDRQQLVDTAYKIVQGLRAGAIKGVITPDLSSKPGVPERQIIPDRQHLAEYNMTVAQLGSAARVMYQGDNSTKFRVNGREYDIRVMLSRFDRDNPDIVNEMPISFSRGNPLFVSSLGKVVPGVGVDQIQRRDRQDEVQVTADLLPGFAAGSVQAQIDTWLKSAKMLPDGVKELAGGQADIQGREGPALFIAMFLGLILVYMLLASLYDNLLYPLVIQLAQPLAMVGALLALMITDSTLNIVGMIGIITLIGLVGKNAILVVDYTNTLRGRGRNRHDALLEAGPTRLRPIMMTTLALILGILPVALALGRGSEFRQTIGITIIGGMSLSTVLTLVVIPCSYTLFDDFSNYLGRVLRRKGAPDEPASGEGTDEKKLVSATVG